MCPYQYSVSYTALVLDVGSLLMESDVGLQQYSPPDSLSSSTFSYLWRQNPLLSLMCQIISHKFLHREIREMNGAYGASLSYDPFAGHLVFSSYRDPKPFASVETFKTAFQWFTSQHIDCQDLFEAKLAIFKELDKPLDLADQGLAEFNYEITPKQLEEKRKIILEAFLEDLFQLAAELFKDLNWRKYSKCVILGGHGENLETIVAKDPSWTVQSVDLQDEHPNSGQT